MRDWLHDPGIITHLCIEKCASWAIVELQRRHQLRLLNGNVAQLAAFPFAEDATHDGQTCEHGQCEPSPRYGRYLGNPGVDTNRHGDIIIMWREVKGLELKFRSAVSLTPVLYDPGLDSAALQPRAHHPPRHEYRFSCIEAVAVAGQVVCYSS